MAVAGWSTWYSRLGKPFFIRDERLKIRVTDEYLKDLELCGQIMKEEKNDPLLQGGETMMAICYECKFILDRDRGFCNNLDLPYTDFVCGIRNCVILNKDGNCKGFKPQSDESIYETKEDEELAKTE